MFDSQGTAEGRTGPRAPASEGLGPPPGGRPRPARRLRLPGLVPLLLAGCTDASAPNGTDRADAPERYNVVLITVDTLRRDHLGCYGYERPTSPRIDALAAESLLFTRCTSQAPWTTPSIAALHTSQYPLSLGLDREDQALIPEWTLLSEVLQSNGYRTAAVTSHSFCSSEWGFDQGFDVFDESNIEGHKAVTSSGVTDRALEVLDSIADGPFYLWLHYFDPHWLYVEQPEFAEPKGDYDGPVESGMSFADLKKMIPRLEPADVAEIVRLYDSEIGYTDHHIGRLLDGLRSRGLWDRTIVVLTSDHGEEFMEHGNLGHAQSLYEELIGVPLILRLPGESGAVRDEPVGLVDVMPTVAEVLGLDLDFPVMGRSMLAAGSRPVFSETANQREARAVVAGTYKLVRVPTSAPGRAGKERRELFDLAGDPAETKNVLAEEDEVARRLTQLGDEWAAEAEAIQRQARGLELDAEQIEHLRALGYLGDGDG